jgi:hypothetical protein
MWMRILALTLGLTLSGAVAAQAQFAFPSRQASGEDFHVEVGAILWRPEPLLRWQTGGDPDVPPDDVVPLLGLDERRLTEWRLTLKPGRRHRFRLSYLPAHYEQDAVASTPFVLGDASFAAGEPVSTDLRWNQWRVGYQYDLASTERAIVGTILEIRRHRVTADVASDTQTYAVDDQVTVPAVGLLLRGYVHRSVSISLEVGGFRVPGPIGRWITDGDLESTIRDVDLAVTGNISRHLGLQGGYRRVRAEWVHETHRADLKLDGWYAGASVRF